MAFLSALEADGVLVEFLSIFGSRLFVRLFGVLFLAIGLRHARRVGTKPLGSLRQGFGFIFCFFRLRDRYEDEDEDEDERGNEIVARCQNEYHGCLISPRGYTSFASFGRPLPSHLLLLLLLISSCSIHCLAF